ncbi:MAG: hypothetical protein CSYNP_00305 [Syntrophus sp. SKADARSKE-3]|nr:hypothetical protein [Syntrophus sp. SKADARSKE-3]
MKKLIVLTLLLMLCGCAHWLPAGGPYSPDSKDYSVQLPEKWMRLNIKDSKYVIMTRDGIRLQSISVETFPVEKALKYTKKKLTKDMLPQEAAEVIIDNAKTNPVHSNFEIIENVPMTIAGHQGFKVVYSFRSKDGLRSRSVYCGFIHDGFCYGIVYAAAARYYFDKDFQTYEKVLASFKL